MEGTRMDYKKLRVFMHIMTLESTGITYSSWDDKFHYGSIDLEWAYGVDNQFTREWDGGWVCLHMQPVAQPGQDPFLYVPGSLVTALACRWKMVGCAIQYDLLWDPAAVIWGRAPRRDTWTVDGPNPMRMGTIPAGGTREVPV